MSRSLRGERSDLETIRLELAGPVARVTFNRPEVLNAGNAPWVVEVNEVIARLAAHPELRVVVLTGAGRAFSTGVDLYALADGAFGFPDFAAWEDAMTAIERMDAVFIAAINGHCLGGGLQLALVCDYRIASKDALIGLPAVKECLIPSMALYRLPRLIGVARAKELILIGASISAAEAERYGLVNQVVAAEEFSRALDEVAERFLAVPATSLAASKRLTTQAFEVEFDEFRKQMETAFKACLASDDYRAAMTVIRARRSSPKA